MIGDGIFGIGLSRTGTTTFSKTLEHCGIRILHNPRTLGMTLYPRKYQGSNDIPVCAYFKELDDKYKKCKFIYTVREQKDWEDAIYRFAKDKEPKTDFSANIRKRVYGSEMFSKSWYDAAKRYDEDVREYFKDRPEDLLILDIVGGEDTSRLEKFLQIKNMPKRFKVYNRG